MKFLTLGDVQLILRDFLTDKETLLGKSDAGRLFTPRLRKVQTEINAQPDVTASGANPLSAELGQADVTHDGLGAAVYHLCEAVKEHPRIPAEMKEAVIEVERVFVPALGVLKATYADEAAAALKHKPDVARLKSVMKSVQVPGGGTLYDWANSFVGAGDDIDKLLRRRAEALALQENSKAGPLRANAIGLIARLRSAIHDEIADAPDALPKDYEKNLFAYFDKLVSDRDRQAPTEAPVVPTPATPVPAMAGTAEDSSSKPTG